MTAAGEKQGLLLSDLVAVAEAHGYDLGLVYVYERSSEASILLAPQGTNMTRKLVDELAKMVQLAPDYDLTVPPRGNS
jgi:hypothetical protein